MGALLRIGPALAEIVARTQEGSPIICRRSPYAVLASAVVVGHSVNTVPMEIRTAYLPAAPLGVRPKDECSFCRAQQQKKVPLSDMSVPDTVQDSSPGCPWIGVRTGGNDSSRLNRFQSCLNFTRALISLDRFLGQAALNNGPQAGGYGGRAQRIRDFAHDSRADLEARASFKGPAAGSSFVEHHSKRP